MATIQSNTAWQLDAAITAVGPDQHFLKITSFVPTARRPQEQVKFTGTFTVEELRRLRDVLDDALTVAGAKTALGATA